MGVKVTRKTNRIHRLTKVLNELGKKSIKVGVFGEDNYKYGDDANLVTIARVHEYGVTINPVDAEWLTIPLIPEAKGKRAGEFDDLFFYQPNGADYALLGRKNGENLQNVFLLVKEVNIPERSFLRTGFDENVDKIADKIERLLNDVLEFDVDPDYFANAIGKEFAGLIQKKMKRLSSPPKSDVTLASSPGKTNPLHDTGRLIGSIRHEVE